MHISPLLGPVIALAAWSMVMMIWMYVVRFIGMKRAGVSPRGLRGTHGLDGIIADEANWKAHNYSHLMEQPTVFYAIVIALVLMGFDHPINVYLAWAYVALRVVHSLIQSIGNVVTARFLVFNLGSLCLIGLITHAAIFFIHHG
jgi:hypothetical protein